MSDVLATHHRPDRANLGHAGRCRLPGLIGERLQRAGFSIESLRFGEVDNLWATHGDGDGPVLVLLGHTDVVPTGPREAWASDPFAPEIRDGVLYGRGAADMKGSVAAFVVALERSWPHIRGMRARSPCC
jgi:succinyl-diaminopimelate desuccinylase